MSIDPALHRIALNGVTMGTRYSCVFYAPHHQGHQALASRLHSAVTDVDQAMSNWKADSVMSHLNAQPPGGWFSVPPGVLHVLETALAIEAASCGAFDIGVAAEVAAWGFGPNASRAGSVPPTRSGRSATRANLEIDRPNRRVRKHAPLALDLSGIAKGYGVDQLGAVLDAAGIPSWLVGIDGEMRGRGSKPDGTAWAVGHECPVPGQREIMGVIELTDLAVATSGTYRHFRTLDDRVVSHTINPASGCPVDGALASVTVLAGTCMDADAWATAILVDGHWPTRSFPAPAGIEAIVTATETQRGSA